MYESLVPEVTVFCGAEGGISLRGRMSGSHGRLTQRTISFCNKFMLENPDYTPVICKPGAEDSLNGMNPTNYENALRGLAAQLRSSIHNAENAFS